MTPFKAQSLKRGCRMIKYYIFHYFNNRKCMKLDNDIDENSVMQQVYEALTVIYRTITYVPSKCKRHRI